MNARDEFYRILGDDLTLYGKESVLYQYLEEEQEKRAAENGKKDLGKARSYQVRIRYYRQQLKKEAFSPGKYLMLLLEILLQKPQFARRCGKEEKGLESKKIIGYTSQDPQPMLNEVLRIALGHKNDEKKVNTAQDMKDVYDIFCERTGAAYKEAADRLEKKGFWKPPFTKLMRLTDIILDVAIAYDIREFFFDTSVEKQEGYSVSKRQKDSGSEKGSSRAERTDKSLKLIDSYCKKRGKFLFGTGQDKSGRMQPSDIECDALYRGLLEEGNDEVFVPLLIDGVTGCGIYLIGKAYFEGEYINREKEYQKIEESCAYGVLFFDNDYGEGIRTGYHIQNEFGEFPDYNSARFDGDWSYESVRQETEAEMREHNGKMLNGISNIFRNYFTEDTEQEDTEQEMKEYRQETKEDVAEYERKLREKYDRF